jgi:peptide/nickel transport system permease protein
VARYVQAAELPKFPVWLRTEKLDLVYIGYGLAVVALVFASYLAGAFGWLPHDAQAMNVALINAAPFTPGYPLGADFLGRDLLSRLVLGIQAYFLPGLLAVALSLVGGSVLGILAGWRGGWWDALITYFANLLDSFPRLVLILLVIAAFKPDIYYIMVVVGITSVPVIANLVAGKIAFLRQKSFIEAAHALGLPAHTVILKHILWFNCRALLVIQATLGMAEAILIETSLSYLGFGVQEPTPSWGNMVLSGANYFLQGYFWPSTAPALAILATILGFQLLGDGLNNLLEGKRRR